MGKCNEQRTGHAKVDLSLEMSSLPETRGQIRESRKFAGNFKIWFKNSSKLIVIVRNKLQTWHWGDFETFQRNAVPMYATMDANFYSLFPVCFTAISRDRLASSLIPLKSKGGLPSRLEYG